MFKNPLQLYSLLICTFSVVIMVIALSFSWISVTDILFLDYKSSDDRFNSNDSYLIYYKEANKDLLNLTPAELEKKRLVAKEDSLISFKNRAIASLINGLGWFLVSLICLFIHYKLYNKSLSSRSTDLVS